MKTLLELGALEEGEWRAGLLTPRDWSVTRGRRSRRIRCTALHHWWPEPEPDCSGDQWGWGTRQGGQPAKQSKVFFMCVGESEKEKPERAAQGRGSREG